MKCWDCEESFLPSKRCKVCGGYVCTCGACNPTKATETKRLEKELNNLRSD